MVSWGKVVRFVSSARKVWSSNREQVVHSSTSANRRECLDQNRPDRRHFGFLPIAPATRYPACTRYAGATGWAVQSNVAGFLSNRQNLNPPWNRPNFPKGYGMPIFSGVRRRTRSGWLYPRGTLRTEFDLGRRTRPVYLPAHRASLLFYPLAFPDCCRRTPSAQRTLPASGRDCAPTWQPARKRVAGVLKSLLSNKL